MSAATVRYPDLVRKQHVPAIGILLILILSILLAGTILIIVRSAHAELVERVPVSQNSIPAIPVPTPPTADNQPIASETPAPVFGQSSEPVVVPVPVPTP